MRVIRINTCEQCPFVRWQPFIGYHCGKGQAGNNVLVNEQNRKDPIPIPDWCRLEEMG
ncbi:MAG: hypothetical protein O8C58_06010 [Candidatus Methanoperedens sp.]|nr:hypothetical protein [Candidatus Methanoperedens sp.]